MADVDERHDVAAHVDQPPDVGRRSVHRRVRVDLLDLLHVEDVHAARDVFDAEDDDVGRGRALGRGEGCHGALSRCRAR